MSGPAVDFDQLEQALYGWTGTITQGRDKSQRRWRLDARWRLSFAELVALLDPRRVPEGVRADQLKNGTCLIPGGFAPDPEGSGEVSKRHAAWVAFLWLAVYDFDSGTSYVSIVERLRQHRVPAIIVPTYSHRQEDGVLSIDARHWPHYLATFGTAEETVRNWLKNRYITPVELAGPVTVQEQPARTIVAPDGTTREVRPRVELHYRLTAGVPRWRVYIPLKEPWYPEDGPSLVAAKAWSEAYLAVRRALGFDDADPSCADAPRLHFDARWPRGWPVLGPWGSPPDGEPGPLDGMGVVVGALQTMDELAALTPGEPSPEAAAEMARWAAGRAAWRAFLETLPGQPRGKRKPGEAASWVVSRPDGRMMDLERFRQLYGRHLPVKTWIMERRPEWLSEKRPDEEDGHQHIVCPLLHLHSDQTDQGGTFCTDLDERGRGRVVCDHTHGQGMLQGAWLEVLLNEGVTDWAELDAIAAAHSEEPGAFDSLEGLDAVEVLPAPTRTLGPLELNPNDPMAAARLIMRRFWMQEDDHTLIEYQSICYSWLETHYRPWSKREFNARVWRILEEAWKRGKNDKGDDVLLHFQPNTKSVANVEAALRAVALVPDRIRPPAWLSGGHEHPAHELIALENGILHWPTRTLLEATPRLFSVNCLPFAYDPRAPEPVAWLRFLRQLWPHDQSSIDALQEMFGYILSGDTSQQKAFLMLGPPRSGRGTIARVLAALLGKDAVVGSSLEELGSPFGLENLIDKQLAILGDIREASKPDYGTAVERVLGITGEDIMGVRRKGIASWSGQLLVRFLMLANEVPPLPDTSGALLTRLLIWNLTESWAGREDTELTETLLKELAGILNWALRGADRLRQMGRFTIPGSGQTVIGEIQRVLSPVRAFVDDCCLEVPDLPDREAALCEATFQLWRQWCSTNNLRRGMYWTPAYFSTQLRAVLPKVVVVQPRSGVSSGVSEKGSGVSGVSNPRRYAGLKLRKIGPDKLDA